MLSPRPTVLLCAAAIALTCTACSVLPFPQSQSTPSASLSQSEDPAPARSTPEPPPPDESVAPSVSIPDPIIPDPVVPDPTSSSIPGQDEPEPIPAPPPCTEPSGYDFSLPVPESPEVENSYFADAAYVGDSRTEGFYMFSHVKQGTKLSVIGLSVFNLDEKPVLTVNGTAYTLLEALSLQQYGKIYMGFGINELGYPNAETFYDAYCQTIDTIRALQPNAILYVQTIIPLNEERVTATGGAPHLKNNRVRAFNEAIRKAAEEKNVPLLDLYAFFEVDGSLPATASKDGVHLTGEYCRKQLSYMKSHTVSFDTLYPQPNTKTEVPSDETTHIPAADPAADPDSGSLLPPADQSALPADSN